MARSFNQANVPPAPGQMVDVGGYRLHVQCAGESGPTVVLDSGLGGMSPLWANVLPALAPFARACAVDRAGYAWSDPAPDGMRRTSPQIVSELRTAMAALGAAPPYVLAGHSFGGINVLVWAYQHPEEVAGLVLVDSSHPQMFERVPGIPGPVTMRRSFQFFTWLGRLNLMRWIGPPMIRATLGEVDRLPAEALEALYAFGKQPRYYETAGREAAVFDESFAAARGGAGSLGDLPVIWLTAGWWVTGKQTPLKQTSVALRQEALALSSCSRHEIVEGCTHADLPILRPEAVADAVRWVIEQNWK